MEYGIEPNGDAVPGNMSRVAGLFVIVVGFVVIVFGTISFLIFRDYPVNQEIRERMTLDLQKRKTRLEQKR